MADPALLIHGMWASGRELERFAGLLRAHGFDPLAPDLPGHTPGTVDPALGRYSLRNYVDALAGEVANQGWTRPPIIVGHSMGGLLAMQLAARIPALALVLLAPAPPSNVRVLSTSALPAFFGLLRQGAFWSQPYKPSFEALRRVAFVGIAARRHRELYERWVPESGRAIFEVGLWPLDREHAARVDFTEIRCPVYVVACGRDRLVPAAAVRRIAARFPAATLRFWPERGHWVIDDDDTEQMIGEIVGWLRPILARQRREATRR